MIELETLTVRGTPSAMGRAHGEALAAPIKAFMGVRFAAVRQYAADRGQPNVDTLLDIAARCMKRHARWDPPGVEEHEGIAAGAGVDPVELYAATNMTDMRDVMLLSAPSGPIMVPRKDEGCSSLLVPGSHTADGRSFAGQTWDLNPPDVEYIYAIHRMPDEGPRTWSVTCSGCLTLVGINEHGVAVGTTNIKTYGAAVGVGYLGVLHRAVRARSAEAAADWIEDAPIAGAHTYWMADAEQQIEFEASPRLKVQRDTSKGPVWRTNHCLAEQHVDVQAENASDSSRTRFDHIGGVLNQGGHDVDSLKKLFADRSHGVLSVNRYAEDEQGTATNSVFIADPANKRAFACRGPADRGRWIELAF